MGGPSMNPGWTVDTLDLAQGSTEVQLDGYSVAETARLIGRSESGVRRIIDRGLLRTTRDAKGRIRVVSADVDRYRARMRAVTQQQPLFDGGPTAFPTAPPEWREPSPGVPDRRTLEETVDQLRREVVRLRAVLQDLLLADSAKRDAIAQLIFDDPLSDGRASR